MKARQFDCQRVLFVTPQRGELLKERRGEPEILIIDFEADMINEDFTSSAIKSQVLFLSFIPFFSFSTNIPMRHVVLLKIALLSQLNDKLLED